VRIKTNKTKPIIETTNSNLVNEKNLKQTIPTVKKQGWKQNVYLKRGID
jgi:hypothetical protein